MKKLSILYILIVPIILLAQKDGPQLFEPALIKADIDTLVSTLQNCHPTFLEHYNANNIQHQIDSIKNSIVNPISSLDFYQIMQPIIAIDGHTTLIYRGEVYPKIEAPFFPFEVIIYNKNLYVKKSYSEQKAIGNGSIIESINGIPAKTIIANLTKYIHGEKESYKLKTLANKFHIYFRLVYGSFSNFTISINNGDYKIAGVKWQDITKPSRRKFELKFYDNDIAYIYKRKFKPPKDFMRFMDSAFTAISEKKSKYLIIDNLQGGGMTDLADSLMLFFADKPYCMFDKKITKISPFTEEFIESKKSEGYIKDDYFIQEFSPHKNRENNFNGMVYILTGPLSYSTGTCFPAAAKTSQNAIIVGEETGQPLISNGNLNRFTLTNTKLTCFTSLSKIYMPGNNGNTMKGVVPDYLVVPGLEELLSDENYTLKYVLGLIRKNKRDAIEEK